MTTKYVDTAAIMQVIGCVYNCPSLLDQEDKYNIIDEDFVEEFHKIVFGAIYKIYTLGSKKITLSNISDFLSSRPKSEAVYMQQKGEEWLTRVSANSDLSSFDYYYNRLKKFSLLRAYDNCGIDVTEIYDPDNILDIKRKQVQEEALDNSTLAEIAQKIDDRIDSIKLSYIDENNTDSVQAGEGMIDLLEQYQAVPEIGVPLFGPMVNTVTRGARLKKFYLRSAPTGLGKAILTTEIIPTPNGYRKAGDIQVGDFLWGPEGRPVRVLARYPQQYQNKIYIITFEDGRQARCCKSHLWYARQEDSDTFETLTTTELNHRMHHYKKKENPFFYVPQTQPPQYREKEFDYPPYIIGPFMMDKKDFLALYTTNDNLRLQIDSALGYSSSMAGMVKISNKPYINDFDTYRLTEFPTEYLMGSAVQREQVLQGFLDFYSQIDPKTSELVITTDNEDIKKNLSEIVYSLGMKCKICDEGLRINCPAMQKHKLMYSLQNKKKLQEYYSVNGETYTKDLKIVSIKETHDRANMICFTVDEKDSLYLMNNYIVTHNTRSMIADSCYVSCDKIYDTDKDEWIQNGIMQPTLYITVEQELSEIQTMMMAFLSGVNEDYIVNGTYPTEEERERVYKAAESIAQSPLYIEVFTDFSLQDIETCIKKNIREHGIKYVFSENEGLCYTFPAYHRGLRKVS